jgi:hypothetical protein
VKLNLVKSRGIALAGIVVCSVLLVLLIALVILGLLWKSLFGRIIWILLIFGLFGVVTTHLYIWVQSYMPNTLDINLAASLTTVIGYTVGFFARLIVLSMLLVLLYFFLQQKFANIVVIVIGAAAVVGLIGIVAFIFTAEDLAPKLNALLDMKDVSFAGAKTKDRALNRIFVPNAVLAGEKPKEVGLFVTFT